MLTVGGDLVFIGIDDLPLRMLAHGMGDAEQRVGGKLIACVNEAEPVGAAGEQGAVGGRQHISAGLRCRQFGRRLRGEPLSGQAVARGLRGNLGMVQKGESEGWRRGGVTLPFGDGLLRPVAFAWQPAADWQPRLGRGRRRQWPSGLGALRQWNIERESKAGGLLPQIVPVGDPGFARLLLLLGLSGMHAKSCDRAGNKSQIAARQQVRGKTDIADSEAKPTEQRHHVWLVNSEGRIAPKQHAGGFAQIVVPVGQYVPHHPSAPQASVSRRERRPQHPGIESVPCRIDRQTSPCGQRGVGMRAPRIEESLDGVGLQQVVVVKRLDEFALGQVDAAGQVVGLAECWGVAVVADSRVELGECRRDVLHRGGRTVVENQNLEVPMRLGDGTFEASV